MIARALRSNERARFLFRVIPPPRSPSPLRARCTNRRSHPRKSGRGFAQRHETRIAQAARLLHAPSYSGARVSSDHAMGDHLRMVVKLTQPHQNSLGRTARHSRSCWQSFDTIQPGARSNACRSHRPTPASNASRQRRTFQKHPADRCRCLSFSTCAAHAYPARCP